MATKDIFYILKGSTAGALLPVSELLEDAQKLSFLLENRDNHLSIIDDPGDSVFARVEVEQKMLERTVAKVAEYEAKYGLTFTE